MIEKKSDAMFSGQDADLLQKAPLPPRYRRIKKETLLSEEEKRLNHIASEQKRRQNIKLAYDQLNALIPGLRDSGLRGESQVIVKGLSLLNNHWHCINACY